MERALGLLERRWAMRVVWALRRDSLGFTEISRRLGVGPSVLSTRLRELAAEGIVEADDRRRYRLTARGRALARVLYELNRWSAADGAAEEGGPPSAAILAP